MSRFLLRNTVRDPKFAALRKKNETKVFLRPFIGGKPLPPAATRILILSDLNPTILSEIEALVAIGNVEFLAVGRQGPAIDFQAIRKELGHVASEAKAVEVIAEVATEVATEVVTEITAPVIADVLVQEEVPVPEVVEEVKIEEPAAAPEASTEVTSAKTWDRSELEALKLAELRDIVAEQGGKWAGKNKSVLVDDILAAQVGV